MAITNQDKPTVNTPETYLNVGSGYNLLVGGTFRLIVGALGLGGMTNSAKTSIGETWGTITTTWDTESRDWLSASQLIENSARTSSSIVNFNKP
jgi:hypothetical protein